MRKVVVIGASSGIGRGLAEELMHAGDFVVLCARRAALLYELHESFPQNSLVHELDVTETGSVEILLKEIFTKLDQFDLLILTSGFGDLNPDLNFETEEKTIEVNVKGFTAAVDCAFNLFVQQGFGQLAVITSIGGLRGGVAAPAYNASKAYQINYLEALQVKAKKLKLPIFVTDIRAGLVNTAMAKGEGLFWVSPVGKASTQILRAIRQKRRIVYVTKRWRLIAWLFRLLPFKLYARF